ncbi:hypothetical protein GCM10007894_19930 [Paraferrimonas haliotis]|uniref:Uncharacterized protein n=1 Tax=Paraferrimonas haliotis TaxID=2013866 RepID=A0AA37TT93_9GAMM|nr:hypothetical protein GCM10007894_19930 [Paraferrimonas haliotis]
MASAVIARMPPKQKPMAVPTAKTVAVKTALAQSAKPAPVNSAKAAIANTVKAVKIAKRPNAKVTAQIKALSALMATSRLNARMPLKQKPMAVPTAKAVAVKTALAQSAKPAAANSVRAAIANSAKAAKIARHQNAKVTVQTKVLKPKHPPSNSSYL